jgi:hypothetical protein
MKRGRAVPLDWNDVVRRYKDGAEIEPTHGVATVSVSGADDEKVYIKHRMWEAALSRHNLEKAVTLLERGKMTRKSDDFIDQYRIYVEDERPTTAATVLKDLGYLD